MRIRTILAGAVCGLLVLAGAAAAAVKVYPVPWAPDAGDGIKYGNTTEGIKFSGVPVPGEILIYSITGELVRSIQFDTALNAKWDGTNSDGSDAASGVYLWVVKGDGTTETGKLIVIR